MTVVDAEKFKMTALGLLSPEWEVVRLDELIEEVREKNKPNLQYPVFTVSNIYGFMLSDEFFDKRVYSKKLNTYKIVRSDCFAYNPYRVNVGSLALFDHEVGLVSPAYIVFRISKPQHLHPPFLYRLIKSPRYLDEIRRIAMSRGSVRRSLSFRDLSDFQVPLPPLTEQKRIAYFLSTVQTAIEKTEAVIKATRALKKSLMKHFFTYGPVSIDETKNVPLKETEIGMIPEEWETVRLGLVSTISTGTTPSTKRADYYCGEVPFIKTSEISNNVIDKAINHISDEAVRDYNLKIYGIGTVFLAMYGQGKTRGQAALLNIAATTTQNTAAIVPNGMLKAEYLWHYLMSRYEFLRSQGFQGQISHLNLGHVKQIMIPLPALRIQEQIIDILDSLQRRAETEENKRQALEALFKTVLSNLMTGKIRVNNLEAPV